MSDDVHSLKDQIQSINFKKASTKKTLKKEEVG